MPLKPANLTYKSVPRIAAQTRIHEYAIFPAPNKGLDVARPLVAQDPLTGIVLNNWWVRKWGPELRGGYKRWTTNLGGGTRTLMPYNTAPGPAGSFQKKLFAACNDLNIYDVTSQTGEGVTPAAAVNLPGQDNPGRLSYTNISVGGVNYLAVCGAGAGYWTYDHAGGWVDRTAAVTGTGGAVTDFDFVMQWKNRLWFIQHNTGKAWFLPVDSIQGAASGFDFGPLLVHGGMLSILSSWTVDAGDGIDDKLVAIGSEGDVLIYAGTDPTSVSTFGIEGRWYIGNVPSGRRFASDTGGDLAIITENGIEYISKIQQGRGLRDPETPRDSPSYRFNEEIGAEVRRTRGQEFWNLIYNSGEEAMIVASPRAAALNSLQFTYTTLPTAWSTFSNMPMRCMELFNGELYFADDDGKVYEAFTVNSDDELSDGTVGTTIYGDVQTAYVTDPKNPMRLKRPLLICPMFQAPSAPSLVAQINTEWGTVGTPGVPAFLVGVGSLWDSALWDTATWSEEDTAYASWLGCSGLGAYLSLRMRVAALPGTIFTSWKLVYEPGGIM